ncbi:hypothetical protein [Streptomyces sp. YIM S03343]
MSSKLAVVVGTVALAVTVGFGAAAPVHPAPAARPLANGTGPATHTS